MAKKTPVVITGLKAVRDRQLEFINKQTKDPEFLEDLAKTAADLIRAGVQTGKEEYKQKPLSPVTVEARKLLAGNNGTGPFFDPKVSNLTMTGQLLRSISSKINKVTSEIVVYIKDERSYGLLPISKDQKNQLYNTIIDKDHNATNRKRRESYSDIATGKTHTFAGEAQLAGIFVAAGKQEKKTNSEIVKDLKARGREFFFFSEKLKINLSNRITMQMRRKLSAYNKIVRRIK